MDFFGKKSPISSLFGNKETGDTTPDATPEATEPTSPHKSSPSDLFASAQYLAGAAQTAFSGGADEVDKAKAAGAAEDVLDAASDYGNLEGTAAGGYVDQAEAYLHKYRSTGATADDTPTAPIKTTTTTTTETEPETEAPTETETEAPTETETETEAPTGTETEAPTETETETEAPTETETEAPTETETEAPTETEPEPEPETETKAPIKHAPAPQKNDDGGDEAEGDGGLGGYMKVAQGFMK